MAADTYPSTEAEHVRTLLIVRDDTTRNLVERRGQKHRND